MYLVLEWMGNVLIYNVKKWSFIIEKKWLLFFCEEIRNYVYVSVVIKYKLVDGDVYVNDLLVDFIWKDIIFLLYNVLLKVFLL